MRGRDGRKAAWKRDGYSLLVHPYKLYVIRSNLVKIRQTISKVKTPKSGDFGVLICFLTEISSEISAWSYDAGVK